jgi:hypothetical protein
LIRALSKESSQLIATTSLNYQLAILTIPRLSDAGMKEAQEKAGVAAQDIWNAVYPWAATEQKRQKEDEYAKILADYKAQIGDPSDPEFIRQLEERINEARLEQTKRGPTEDDVARLERRLLERSQRTRGL